MSHSHSGCGNAHLEPHLSKALTIALWIAFCFMLVEFIGGWIANSLALISDALHMFTDVGALLLGLIVVKITKLPSTSNMSYGYHRAEILGAMASALSLWALTGFLVYESIKRLITPEAVEGPVVFVIASIGLLANLWMMRVLHPAHTQNLNARAAYLHIIGDVLGSVGVIVSGLILWITKWNLIDPIVTIVLACVILYSATKIINESINILMESTPGHINPDALKDDLLKIPGVKEVHDLHIWSVSSKRVAMSAHLIADSKKVLKDAHQLIEKNYHIQHMTIQVEDPEHFESRFCYDCQKDRK